MKRLFAGLPALVLLSQILLCLVSLLPPVQAQTAARPAGPLSYDVSEERTLHGTVSSVVTKPATGMIVGSHLLLTTIFGPVDASLGVFGLPGKDVASVAAGQQVEVTGTKSPSMETSSDAATRTSPSPVTLTITSIKTIAKECPAR